MQINQLRIKTCVYYREKVGMTSYALKKKGEYDFALKAFSSNKGSKNNNDRYPPTYKV